MIQIFDIKKKRKNLKIDDAKLLEEYKAISKFSNEETLTKYKSSLKGLTKSKSKILLDQNGLNTVIKDDKKPWIYFLLVSFNNQFIIILLVLAIINGFLGDKIGSLIIIGIAFVSALIRFFQDYSVYRFNRKLKSRIYSMATVIRDNEEKDIKTEKVVVGDIVKLNAGSIIPADLKLIETKDLFVNQSVFTGESVPVEKKQIIILQQIFLT